MEYYWELLQFDGTVTQIPPNAVDTIKRRWDAGEPIHLSIGSIPANQIKAFRLTDKLYNSQPLIEEVAQAFKEPLLSEDGSIKARWVKKHVTNEKWNKHYSAIHSYRHLGAENGMTIIAFKVPTHLIDYSMVQDCDDNDIKRLTSR
jgi:hypothetical protein